MVILYHFFWSIQGRESSLGVTSFLCEEEYEASPITKTLP